MVVFGIIVFIALFYKTAGYGKFISMNCGPAINNKTGWAIMEIPTVIVYIFFYIIGDKKTFIIFFFLVFWLMHYGSRSFIFPALIRGNTKMPLSIILSGMIFNTANAYLQGRWINSLSPGYETNLLLTPMFVIGAILFFVGFLTHVTSDRIICTLRKPGETEHKIPYGGMFHYVSNPNYLGEIIQWIGWAMMTRSIQELVFALWTFFNLAPRARSNHHWYLDKFEDYPKDRKALIPFIF